MLQFSHLYMTTGKTIALTFELQIFVGKVISLLFNTLSRFVIAFLLARVTFNSQYSNYFIASFTIN